MFLDLMVDRKLLVYTGSFYFNNKILIMIKLTEKKIQTLKSMNIYWEEISHRDESQKNRIATAELFQLLDMGLLKPMDILELISDYIKTE